MRRLILSLLTALSFACRAHAQYNYTFAPSVLSQKDYYLDNGSGVFISIWQTLAGLQNGGAAMATDGHNASSAALAYIAAPYYIVVNGLTGNGATDNTSLLQAAFTAANTANAKNIKIVIPNTGNFLFTGPLTITASYVTLEGEGIGTALVNANCAGDGIVFAGQSLATETGNQLAKIRITSTCTAPTAGAALHLIKQNSFSCGEQVQLKEHFGDLLVEGGAVSRCAGLSMGSGQYWSCAVLSGSYMFNIIPASDGSLPGTWIFDAPNWQAENPNSCAGPVMQYGVILGGADGVWFNGGHIGFAQTNYYLYPADTTHNIFSIISNGTYWDGNSESATDISIPQFTSGACPTTGNLINNIQFNGGSFNNTTADAFDLSDQCAAQVQVNGVTIKNIGGWGMNVTGARNLKVDVTCYNCGTTVSGSGGLLLNGVTNGLVIKPPTFDKDSGITMQGPCMEVENDTAVTYDGPPLFNSACPTNAHMLVSGNQRIPVAEYDLNTLNITTYQTLLQLTPSFTAERAGLYVHAELNGGSAGAINATGTRISDWDVSIEQAAPVANVVPSDRTYGSSPLFRINMSGNNAQLQVAASDQSTQISSGTANFWIMTTYYKAGANLLTWEW